MWVTVETAVTPASAVHVRRAGAGNAGSAFRATADAGDTLDVSTIAKFESSAPIGGLAVLAINFQP